MDGTWYTDEEVCDGSVCFCCVLVSVALRVYEVSLSLTLSLLC